MKKIFITGISGCVGHYLFDLLGNKPEYSLFLLVRNEKKLFFNPAKFNNATILREDLKNIEKCADTLKDMDAVVHLAADWGGNEGNYDYTLSFFKLLDPNKCKRVIYFSTASILGDNGRPLPECEKFGTHYIRSKYRLHKYLPKLPIYPNVITLFPTWVLGGDKNHPYSHASSGIIGMKKWLWLARFFTVDASFHFIHAKDMAAITKYLLENPVKEKEHILGNDPITASQFIKQVCEFYKINAYFQVPISLPLVQFLAAATGRKLHSWDIFCFTKRHFVYNSANAAYFGIKSNLDTVPKILASFGPMV